MADLDTFFAKKDKKKKSRGGFSKANTDVLAKNLEENERKEQRAEEKATNQASRATRIENNPAIVANEAEEDEWKDYDEGKRDYTGLKIETLKVDDDLEPGEEDDHEINEDGEKVKKVRDGGPWSKLVSGSSSSAAPSASSVSPSTAQPQAASSSETDATDSTENTSEAASKDKEEKSSDTAAAAPRSSYVPPHLRNSQGGSSGSSGAATTVGGPRGAPRRPKHAPDISSEVYFPSLSAAMGADDPKGDQMRSGHDFEEVRGGQQHNMKSTEAPRLALDNKFAALRD